MWHGYGRIAPRVEVRDSRIRLVVYEHNGKVPVGIKAAKAALSKFYAAVGTALDVPC